jgi:hypothetical protein
MKPKYSFAGLLEGKEVDLIRKPTIFGELVKCTKDGEIVARSDSFDWLRQQLVDGPLFVAHDLVRYHGKQPIYEGMLMEAAANAFLTYLRETIANNDLRSLLVAPLFERSPSFVIHVSDEGVFLKFEALTR